MHVNLLNDISSTLLILKQFSSFPLPCPSIVFSMRVQFLIEHFIFWFCQTFFLHYPLFPVFLHNWKLDVKSLLRVSLNIFGCVKCIISGGTWCVVIPPGNCFLEISWLLEIFYVLRSVAWGHFCLSLSRP